MNSLKQVGLTLTLLPLILGAGSALSMPGARPLKNQGCIQGFVQPSVQQLSQALSAAQVRWQQVGVTAYRFTLQETTAPLAHRRTQVTVQGAQVIDASSRSSKFARTASVENLFGAIERSVASARKTPCLDVQVTYAADGHPISFSSAFQQPNRPDNSVHWSVTDFKRQ